MQGPTCPRKRGTNLPMSDAKHNLAPNTGSVALIFEGGGMRNAYTAGVLQALLEEGFNFPKVYGVSAGAELAADYVSRDITRARGMFCEAPGLPEAGGIAMFLTGRGFFNTKFVFGELSEISVSEASKPERSVVADLVFDEETYAKNPCDLQIEALDLKTAETRAWTKSSMPNTAEVMRRIEASCSYPVFTPPTTVDGRAYIDGGMGTSHGVCLESARADGFERFFIVRTRERGFRLKPLTLAKRALYRLCYAPYPEVYKALLARPALYNAQLDEIDRLEREGTVYQFCPKVMPVSYMTASTTKLKAAYESGLAQARGEVDRWRAWLAG